MSLASVDHFPGEPATRVSNGQRSPRRRTLLDQTPLAIKRAPRAGEGPSRSPPIEIAFLSNHGVSIEALNQTAELARRQGVSADAALLAEGVVGEEAFYRALAEHLGVGFLASEIEFAPGALSTAGLGYARLQDRRDGVRWLFAPSGTQIFRLMSVARAARTRPLFAVTTRARFFEALGKAYPQEAVRAASHSAERVDQDLCVRSALRRGPLAGGAGALLLVVASLIAPVETANLAAAFALAFAFLASVFLRLAACAASLDKQGGGALAR